MAFLDKSIALRHKELKGTLITLPKYRIRKPYIYFDWMKWNFTHDFILEWLKGKCKRVILIGCADFIDDIHYNSEKKFRPNQNNIEQSIKYIESITEFKIFKMNKNGVLKIPTITYKEVKNDRPKLKRN